MLAGLILILFEYAKENEINFRSLRALRTQAFKMDNREIPYFLEDTYGRHIILRPDQYLSDVLDIRAILSQ